MNRQHLGGAACMRTAQLSTSAQPTATTHDANVACVTSSGEFFAAIRAHNAAKMPTDRRRERFQRPSAKVRSRAPWVRRRS